MGLLVQMINQGHSCGRGGGSIGAVLWTIAALVTFVVLSFASAVVYETFPGWSEELTDATEPGHLPGRVHDYVAFLTQQVGVPIRLLGVGPGRDQYVQLSA